MSEDSPTENPDKYEHHMIDGIHDVENCWCMNASPRIDSLDEIVDALRRTYTHRPEAVGGKGELYFDEATVKITALITNAQEEAWLEGYEAGHAVGSGNMKGISSEEAKQRIFKLRPDIKAEYERQEES